MCVYAYVCITHSLSEPRRERRVWTTRTEPCVDRVDKDPRGENYRPIGVNSHLTFSWLFLYPFLGTPRVATSERDV